MTVIDGSIIVETQSDVDRMVFIERQLLIVSHISRRVSIGMGTSGISLLLRWVGVAFLRTLLVLADGACRRAQNWMHVVLATTTDPIDFISY